MHTVGVEHDEVVVLQRLETKIVCAVPKLNPKSETLEIGAHELGAGPHLQREI